MIFRFYELRAFRRSFRACKRLWQTENPVPIVRVICVEPKTRSGDFRAIRRHFFFFLKFLFDFIRIKLSTILHERRPGSSTLCCTNRNANVFIPRVIVLRDQIFALFRISFADNNFSAP